MEKWVQWQGKQGRVIGLFSCFSKISKLTLLSVLGCPGSRHSPVLTGLCMQSRKTPSVVFMWAGFCECFACLHTYGLLPLFWCCRCKNDYRGIRGLLKLWRIRAKPIIRWHSSRSRLQVSLDDIFITKTTHPKLRLYTIFSTITMVHVIISIPAKQHR